MNLLFVYGTLQAGEPNHAQLAGQKFIGDARTVAGYQLYELDGYPGMVAKAGTPEGIFGEVWAVDDDALVRLDQFEGVSEGLYRRARVNLIAPFANQVVETYLYAGSVAARKKLGVRWSTPRS